MRLVLPLLLSLMTIAATTPPPHVPPPAQLDVTYRDAAARLIGAALASDHAYLRLSQLCDGIGNRLSGSPSLDRAVAWAAQSMREDGLQNVRLQPVMVPRWVRGEEHAEIVSPALQRLSILGLGRSPGTPPGGITAEVVVVGSFGALDSLPDDAVRGRIVLYDVPFTNYGVTGRYRTRGPRRAALRGAVAALVRSVTPTSLRTPHTGATSDSLPLVPAAAVTLEDAAMIHRLIARGERVRVHLEMGAHTLPDSLSHNVLGEIRGRETPNEVVVIGGHLDSWDVGQGAQDDGGGVVISLEAMRLIRQLGLRPRRTLRCVAWVNEENGGRGGDAYADSLRSAVANHVAALESDGGVERPLGFEVAVRQVGTDSLDKAAGLGAGQITAGGGEADVSRLMRCGVPGISHRTTMEHYFDWHHTQADMLDKVDPVELRKNVAVMAVMAYVLADMPETLAPPARFVPGAPRPR